MNKRIYTFMILIGIGVIILFSVLDFKPVPSYGHGSSISRGLRIGTTRVNSGTENGILYVDSGKLANVTDAPADNEVLSYNLAGDNFLWVSNAGGGSGDVTKVGTPVDNEIGVWTGDGTLEGDTDFQWDGDALSVGTDTVAGGLSVVTIKDGGGGGTGTVDIGDYNGSRGTIWINQPSPSSTNFSLSADNSGNTYFNGVVGVRINIGNSIHYSYFANEFSLGGGQTHSNLAFPSTNGTKLGVTTSEKLAFWNTTPIIQPVNTVAIDTLLANLGLRASGGVANFDSGIDSSSNKIINVADPTLDQDAATKIYVDTATSAFDVDFFFNNTASDVGGIYFDMTSAALGGAETTDLETAGLSAGDPDQPLLNFLTDDTGGIGILDIPAGTFEVHFHAERTGGNSDVNIYAEIYKRASGGAETLIVTSSTSGLVTSKTDFSLFAHTASDTDLLATDRVLVKFFANLGSGSGATVEIYAEGTTVSRLAFPTTTEILNQIFLRQDGTEKLAGAWDTDNQAITNINIDSGVITGITDLAIADGGTGASDAATAFSNLKQAATKSATGVVELATTAEIDAGTDSTRAMPVDQFEDSAFAAKYIEILVNNSTDLTTGDLKAKAFTVPTALAGWSITEVVASRTTGTGTDTYMLRNLTQGQDVLLSVLPLNADDLGTSTTSIDTAQDDLTLFDQFVVDVDSVGSSTKFMSIQIKIERIP